jgi:hypothetical protein
LNSTLGSWCCDGAGFPLEAVGELGAGDLDRYDSVQAGVARLIDFTHARMVKEFDLYESKDDGGRGRDGCRWRITVHTQNQHLTSRMSGC